MKKVAIAILCDSMSFSKWQADVIRAVRRHECCEVRGVIIAENVELPIAGEGLILLENLVGVHPR